MILQALKEYYDRKAADPSSDIAPEGFEKKEIPFLVVIEPDGKLVALEDTREPFGKRLVGKTFLLPRSQQRCGSRSYETTFLLWDHCGYLFGYPESDEKSPKQHKTWLDKLNSLPDELKTDEAVAAVLNFYQSNGVDAVKANPNWNECTRFQACNMTFRLVGDKTPVPCRPKIQEYVRASIAATKSEGEEVSEILARCLVTGQIGEIARTHGRTPINRDTKSLVNFQKNSGYDSYGKEQGYNAPVSKSAEFAYTTALNHLLNKDSKQRMLIGDATTVFWAEKLANLETDIVDIFGEPSEDDPDRCVKAVRSLYQAIETGATIADHGGDKFYVLGLAPNVARIAVRFWIVDTVAGMAGKIVQHFDDLRIVHRPHEKNAISLFRLMVSTAVQGKSENIPPNLAGETMRAILSGLPYPQTLLQTVIRRVRAEQSAKDKRTGKSIPNVTYARASLVKAYINRKTRFVNPQIQEELKMSLDLSNGNIGYRLGRLFATLEKIQAEANPGINATIRDRFYGAASGTPGAVFSNLMRLKNHHLAKLKSGGRRVNFERLIAEIVDDVIEFPSHLSLADQGRFAIGYYHQSHDFYTKKANELAEQKSIGKGEIDHE